MKREKDQGNKADLVIVKDSLRKMYEAKQEYERVKKYYEDVRKKEQIVISNYMFTNLGKNQNSFSVLMDEGAYFYSNKKEYSVSRVRSKKVIWDVEAIEKKLPKKILKKILKKTYTIEDIPGLVEYLKSFGVDPTVFKGFLRVDKSVDTDAVEKVYDLGEINRKDVEGCYTVEFGEPYIKMVEKRKKDDTSV